MHGVILNNGVADFFERVYPAQDLHPNISQHDFLPSEFDFPLLSFFLQYPIHYTPYGVHIGRHLPTGNPWAGVCENFAVLLGQPVAIDSLLP